MAKLGLTLADLFATAGQARTNSYKRIVKVYDYVDAHGTLVHQTVRYEPKDFKQRRPDPAHPGAYIWRTKDIVRVLFNLPAVLAAIRTGVPVHLAEGEKDAETLIAMGLVATTVPQGAKYWRDSYTATLTGAHVVLWPDNDKAGQASVLKVQGFLSGKAQTLRMVRVPAPHKDVSDWIQAGGTRAEVEALIEAATPPPPNQEPAAWTDQLNTTKGGEPKETFNNLVLALEHLDPWDTQSWYDLVRDRGMISTQPLDEVQIWRAARAIEQHARIPIRNLKLVMSALRSQCVQTPRDLLQEWLAALNPWDGVERLTEWLCDHAGVPKTAYTMAVSRLLPVSMVARALHPGIQCRSVVIFEGPQDIGKSELVKRLAGEAWYRIVDSTLEGKEAHMLMKGVWIVELAEMDVMLRTEESRVKSFVTMCNDEFVPKYANDPVKLARRTILVGTINPEGDGSYLRDQTGATRYYPVRVGTIALEDITAARDQLFAEALQWFQAHPTDWWQMPDDAKDELVLTREARRKEGVYEGPRLKEWLDKVRAGTTEVLAPFHTEDALRYCFQIPPERWTHGIKDQVGKAIGKGGWESKSSRARGDVQRLWHYVGTGQ
jgi:predicted P-loop ATPase